MDMASRVVSESLLGLDGKAVTVGGKAYVIPPPTIKRIVGAAYHLSALVSEGDVTVMDVIASMKDLGEACSALSWFIVGDTTLAAELSDGTPDEVTTALMAAYSLISVENFTRLSTLARNVAGMTARPRPSAVTRSSGT